MQWPRRGPALIAGCGLLFAGCHAAPAEPPDGPSRRAAASRAASRDGARHIFRDVFREPSRDAQRDAESRLERIKRVTARACAPQRNTSSFRADIGHFCVPFDSIPAVDEPSFTRAGDAGFLPGSEPVVAVGIGGEERGYPVRILNTHEVVNDTIEGVPVAVTYCPLCNSAVAFDRRVAGRTLTFGVSGQLVTANLVMFDRETLTLWQQLTGEALGGTLQDHDLEMIPARMVPFEQWAAANPDGPVMKEPRRGFDYGADPYAGYDRDPREDSKFFRAPGGGERGDDRLPPKWRVVGVAIDDDAVAFPMPRKRGPSRIVHARVAGMPVAVFYRWGIAQTGKAARLAGSPRGWSATAWIARHDGRRMRFTPAGDSFREEASGSLFDATGRAVSGSLRGERLSPAPQLTSFWFAWSFFHPDTRIVAPRGVRTG